MANSDPVVILCTEDELLKIIESQEVSEDSAVLNLSTLFDVLLEHYGYDSYWPTNDVY